MTQHTDQGQPSGGLSFRRSLLSVLTLLLLTGLMFLIFQDHLPEIRQAIGKLSPAQLGLLLALALTYPLIEGVISQRVLASRVPGVLVPARAGPGLSGRLRECGHLWSGHPAHAGL